MSSSLFAAPGRAAWRLSAITSAVLLISACATPTGSAPAGASAGATPAAASTAAATPPAAASAPAGAASGAATAARPPADPTAPKPFADVIKDAKRLDGYFALWRKDEKVWLEIPTSALNKPLMLSVNIANSVGERGLYASQMGPGAMVEWKRIGNQVQLLAVNTRFRAVGGNQRAVEQAFSPSLIAAAPVASAEHPERKAFLIDASLLLSDIPGYSTALEAAYRLPFGLDRGNSYFEAARTDAKVTTLTARMHFATPRIPAPPLTPSPVPQPSPPTTVPDPRSLFVSYVYSFQPLPEKVMAARTPDPRIGIFSESFTDLSSDLKAKPRA